MSSFMRSLERRLADPEFRAGYEDTTARLKLIAELVASRQAANLNQSQVADRMGVGQSTVSQFEGSADPRLSTVQRYARAVGAKVHFVVAPGNFAKAWPAPQPTQSARRVWTGQVTASSRPSAFAKAA